jgi:hypothetical protein
LAAVPDDADLATLDDRQISIVVVEHLYCHSEFLFLVDCLLFAQTLTCCR